VQVEFPGLGPFEPTENDRAAVRLDRLGNRMGGTSMLWPATGSRSRGADRPPRHVAQRLRLRDLRLPATVGGQQPVRLGGEEREAARLVLLEAVARRSLGLEVGDVRGQEIERTRTPSRRAPPLPRTLFCETRLLFTAGSAIGGSAVAVVGVRALAAHQPRTPIPTKSLFSTVFLRSRWSETPASRIPMPGGRKLWKVPDTAGFGRLLSRTSLCSITQLAIDGLRRVPGPVGMEQADAHGVAVDLVLRHPDVVGDRDLEADRAAEDLVTDDANVFGAATHIAVSSEPYETLFWTRPYAESVG